MIFILPLIIHLNTWLCASLPFVPHHRFFFSSFPLFFRYAHDPRLVLLENTLLDPADVSKAAATDSGDAPRTCPSVAKTFVNGGTCARRSSCAPTKYVSKLP